MGLKIAICDDEEYVIKELKKSLLNIRTYDRIDCFSDGESLLKSSERYDAVFLDVEMGKISGMDVARYFTDDSRDEKIIFLTSHTEVMPEAFKVRAFRFLIKPIEKDKLLEAVEALEKEKEKHTLVKVITRDKVIFVRKSEIIYLEAAGDFVYIYTLKGIYEAKVPISNWEDILGKDIFYRVHKSYIVSFNYIRGFSREIAHLKVVEIDIPIARRRRAEFKDKYLEYLRRYEVVG